MVFVGGAIVVAYPDTKIPSSFLVSAFNIKEENPDIPKYSS
jgi:hypothetical protein